MELTRSQLEAYRTEGYTVFEGALPAAEVQCLRQICDGLIGQMREALDAGGGAAGINRSDQRYFVAGHHREDEFLNDFVYGDLMAGVCKALLGDDALLIWEQFIARRGGGAMRFAWHQDSGYVAGDHEPFVNCWCALDDMDASRGTLFLLPGAARDRVDHLNGAAAYEGDEPGVPLLLPAGSVALYSSRVLHRYSPGGEGEPRWAYLLQYAARPLPGSDGEGLWPARYEDLWRQGQRQLPPPWEAEADEDGPEAD